MVDEYMMLTSGLYNLLLIPHKSKPNQKPLVVEPGYSGFSYLINDC